MISVVFFFSFLILLYAVSAQFYSISYLQLKSPKEDIMAVSQCCLCCPLVFCAIFALLPFFLFLRCQRPCVAPLPVVYTILDISETSFFVTPIGFLSTQNRWIRLPRLCLRADVSYFLCWLCTQANRDYTWNCFPDPGGGGRSLWWLIRGGSARKGSLFQVSGIKG